MTPSRARRSRMWPLISRRSAWLGAIRPGVLPFVRGELQPARGSRAGEIVRLHLSDPVAELPECLADLAR